MATESEDAWTLGPAESRLIRVCLYLAEGSLGGLLLFWVVAGGQLVLPDLLAGNRWVLAVGAVLVLALARWASFWLWFRRAIRDESHERWWLLRDWLSVYRPSILVAITLLLGVGLLALDQHGLRLPQSEAFSYWFELLFVAAACNALAGALSSKGELDAESLTLRTYRYGQWRELDLRMVSSVHRVNAGDDALLWLSMTPGVEKRIASQGVYSIPRAILDRNWHVFEAGLDAEPPLDPGEIARARFFRRVNRAVAVGFFGVLVAALAVLFWFGMPLWRVLQFTFVVAFVGAILFKVAV